MFFQALFEGSQIVAGETWAEKVFHILKNLTVRVQNVYIV